MTRHTEQVPFPMGDALEKSGFFRDFFESSPMMLASVRIDMAKLAYCNEALCRKLGWRREQLIGADFYSVCHPDSHAEAKRVWREFEAEGDASSKGLHLLHRDGTAIPATLHITASRDRNGRVVAGQCIWGEVKGNHELERLKLDVRLQAAQKTESIALLANSVAHDFNNLLVAILGNADLGKRMVEPGTLAYGKLADIATAARQAADLTRQLMAYSVDDPAGHDNFDLTETVVEMSRLLEVSIAKRAALECQLHQVPVRIRGQVSQIRQIIMNLLTNSAEAVDPVGGRIVLRTAIENVDRETLRAALLGDCLRAGVYGVLEVADNGSGLTSAQKRAMFDPFFTTKQTGHGLGLAAVQNIVRAHGGALRVTSELGQGTSIKLYFPLTSADDPQNIRTPRARVSGNQHVLLVDDEALVRDVARDMLESHDLVVTECQDGHDAMAMYEAVGDTVDIVVMDLSMPDCDGITLYRWLRQRAPEQKVVMMSGLSASPPSSLVDDPNLRFLQKPFDGGSLIDAVANVVASDADEY